MKSVLSVVGLVAVVWFLIQVCGHGSLRGTFENLVGPQYESQAPIQPQYEGTGNAPIVNGDGCGGCGTEPVAERGPSFEYDTTAQRVWVQPVYQTGYYYGRYQRMLVRPGYYRSGHKEKHIGVNLGGIVNSFRR